jgi:Putative transposase
VFSAPHELNVLALDNSRLFYDLLFTASAQTLLEVAADPQHLGAEIGVISILHTWGQNLCHSCRRLIARPHSLDPPSLSFLPTCEGPQPHLSRKILGRLKRLYRNKKLQCAGPSTALADPRQFAQLLRRQDWVVYAKPAFGGPLQVLRYLGRYTHRVAISNHRLLAFDGQRVTFRWKDYTHDGKWNHMTLAASEFLRRFFLHVLPKAFVRIRHFGFLANCFRARRLSLCRQLLTHLSCALPVPDAPQPSEAAVWHCPHCGATMLVLQRFTAEELSTCRVFDSS